jgi:NitT/TauT family transport system permease protein
MDRLTGLAVPFAIFILWHAITAANIIDTLFLPAPIDVARALRASIADGTLLVHAGATLRRAAIGFVVSLAIGLPAGLLIGRVPLAARLLEPTIDFLRSIPPTALLPLLILIFALGDGSKLAVVVYGCSLVILVNAAYGARHVKSLRLASARVLGLVPTQRFLWIVLPESAPQIFAGMRVSLALALVLVVVSEMFGGTRTGLGAVIIDASNRYDMPACYAAILLTGIIGYFLSRSLVAVERRILHWAGQ